MMSRKHYKAIAAVFAEEQRTIDALSRLSQYDEGAEDTLTSLRMKIADVLEADNPRFNQQRFYDACDPESA